MMIHELKCWQPYFDEVVRGKKTFEIREDRNFEVGDKLFLREYDPATKVYSGKNHLVQITYITRWRQPIGQVVMAIKPA